MDLVKHLSEEVFSDFGLIHFIPRPLLVTDPALRPPHRDLGDPAGVIVE